MLLLLFLWFASTPDATSLLQHGLQAMQQGQTTEARTLLEEASHADERNAYVWSSLAEVYRRLHETKKAEGAADHAEKLGANDPLVCHALAMYYSASQRPGRAAPLEQRFAESPKADSRASERAADLYLAAGEPDRASALANLALQQGSSAAKQNLMGRILVSKGKEKEALPYLRNAWESNQADEAETFDYVNALLREQDFSAAAETVEATIKLRPTDAQLELLLGVARYGQRRFDEAVTTFLEVIRLDPDVEQPYLFLGRLIEQAGPHLPEIVKADQAWVDRNPGNAKAKLELAKALLQQNHVDPEALTLLRQAIALDTKDWESHYQLAVMLEGKRDFSGAAEELRQSIALDSKQPMPHYHLARVYDRLGDSTEAQKEREIHARLTTAPKQPGIP